MPFLREKVLIILLYFLFALLLSPYHKYFLHLPDTFQYLAIAEKYAQGNFSEAINSYWSPLFSWILALFIKAGIDPFTVIQILQISSGFISLLGIFKLIPFKKRNRILFLVLHFSLALLILSFALLVATPDLLLLTITIWYIVFISRREYYLNNTYSFLLFGFIGALLYFAKNAGFFFFLLSFTFINCFFFFNANSDRIKISTKYFSTISLFILFSCCWIFLISKKENKILITSAAEYNFNLIGPASNPDILGELTHPFDRIGLIPPFQKTSISAWEHPNKMPLDSWSPFDSKKNFSHYLKIIFRNLWSLQSFYFGLDIGIIPILGILFLWRHSKAGIRNVFYENSIPIIIAISCTIPYVFVLVMDRHVWINTIIISILAASVFQALTTINKNISALFLLLFAAFMSYNPVKELLHYDNVYKNIIDERVKLSEYILGNMASIVSDKKMKGENYAKSTLLSYLSKNKYFGMIHVPDQSNNIADQLKKHKIKYLLSWNDPYLIPDSLYSDKILFPKSGVEIYKLK